MNDQSLSVRLETHRALLVAGWETYLGSLVPALLDRVYSPSEQADMALQALGIAAGRWVLSPGKKPKSPSATQMVKQMRATMSNGRDPVRPSMVEAMVDAFQGAFQQISADAGFEEDMRAMLVPMHLSAIRVAAPRAFAASLPESTTLATLDQHLREHLPSGYVWMSPEATGT